MAETVVYVSKTGFTERYARMLAERLGTRALPLNEAVKNLGKGDAVVFCGRVRAERLAAVNRVCVPLFYLRGGLDYRRMGKAKGFLLKKLVPKVMGVGADGETRKMFAEGGDFVSEENLADVIAFAEGRPRAAV